MDDSTDADVLGGAEPWEKFVVMNQEVDLDVNFRDKAVSGTVKMTIFPLDQNLESIRVDARQMDIDLDNITVDKKKVYATYHDPYERLDIPNSFDWDATQFPYQKARVSPLLLHREDRELPADSREIGFGCAPALGSLVIRLRDFREPPKPAVKLRLTNIAHKEPSPSEISTFEILIPFRSRNVRDGFHFVGVEESDTRYPHVYTIHSGEPGLASCIFPCIDDPGSRSWWTVRVRLPRTVGDALRQPLLTHKPSGVKGKAKTAPESKRSGVLLTEEDKLMDMTVVCAGKLVGDEVDKSDESKKVMTFEMRSKQISALHVGFAVGPFMHVDLWSGFRAEADDERVGIDAIKIHGFCLPGREDEVRYTCEALAQAADFFSTKFGKFPFESYKMCFLDDMVAETMPLCELSLCSSRLLYPLELMDTEQEVTRKLVHALASQYFGVHIIPRTRLDSWITIGVAHFIADLYMGQLCGSNDYRYRMKTRADQLVEEDIDRLPLDELGNHLHLGDHQRDFMALKAPLVLFILDRRLTKRAAHNGLRRVITRIVSQAEYAVKDSARVVSSQTFRKWCERVSHNSASLELFWQHWVHSSGCARFDMSHRYNKKHSRIDVTVRQPEERKDLPPPALTRDNFWGVLQDRLHVPPAKKENVSVWFTGPITIGIHEANGTPYEHVAEIRRMGPRAFKTLEMPYNTKYKRLKRTRRQRERALATAAHAEAGGEGAEDAVLYSLGDVLQGADEMDAWQMADWTAEQEKSMEQDSFEWLRLDADFEWLCSMRSNMQPWMYVSQLQQDRDVVAQQESVLYMSQKQGGEIAASFLAKTLVDTRYFHGIRTQAVRALQKQLWTRDEDVTDPQTGQTVRAKTTVLGGLSHLMRAFRRFFCFPNTQTPQPNDFSNKMQYMVQSAIPGAIARVRDKGRCPPEAQRFILEQLRFNNNASNEYSDHFYVAGLLDALATSLVPEPASDSLQLPRRDDDPSLSEDQAFLAEALQEIERYVRMDEWANSYHNIWTTTALGCKQKLMKAGVIPVSPLDFVQYLQDGTLDLVQIKAFEALVDLGFLLQQGVLRLLLAFMTTHNSPFVRDRLFKVFCSGVAGLAFGEFNELSTARSTTGPKSQGLPGDDMDADGEEDDVLMMDNADAIIAKKKAEEARRSTFEGATKALRQEVGKVDSRDLALEIWRAVRSPLIGLVEQLNLLDICETLFDPDYSCRVTVRHPTRWVAERLPLKSRGHRVGILFKTVPRKFVRRPPVSDQGPALQHHADPTTMAPRPASAAVIGAAAGAAPGASLPTAAPAMPIAHVQRQPSLHKIKLNVLHSKQDKAAKDRSTPQHEGVLPSTAARQTLAMASPAPTPAAASISVVPSAPASATATPQRTGNTPLPAGSPSLGSQTKRPKLNKRKHDGSDSGAPARPSKMVKITVPDYFYKLKPETQRMIRAELAAAAASGGRNASVIRAERKPLPTTSSSTATMVATPDAGKVRRPLPSGPSGPPADLVTKVVHPPPQPNATASPQPPAASVLRNIIKLKIKPRTSGAP